jgi:DUF1016 N-terminal domain/N-6 DNA Methylase
MKKIITKKGTSAPVAARAYSDLLGGISQLLESARRASARAVNTFMTATYWEVGRRIVEFEQGGAKRAVYGEQLLKRLASDLTTRLGRGFSVQNIENMRLFYGVCGTKEISQTLSGKSTLALPASSSTKKSQTLSGISQKPRGNEKKLPRGEYLESRRFPVVDQGQRLIGGYSDDADRVISQDLPLLVSGDHTRAFKYLDQPFVPGADGVKVLKPLGVDAKWLYLIAHALEFPDKGYARHFQHLKTARLFVPPLPEQRQIVAEIEKQFTRLEAGVAALRRVQANLKRYRAAVLKAACEGRLVPTEAEWPHKPIATAIRTMDQGWSPKCESKPSNSTTWGSSLSADVKGDAYEGLLQKNAEDVKGGAGQYFTPRAIGDDQVGTEYFLAHDRCGGRW